MKVDRKHHFILYVKAGASRERYAPRVPCTHIMAERTIL